MTADKDSPMNKEEARCFSEGFVDIVGLEEVKKVGTAKQFAEQSEDLEFTKMNLNREKGGDIYDQFDECGVDIRAAMLEDMTSDDSMSAAAKKCVEKALSEDKLREFFITLMISGQEALQKNKESGAVMQDVTKCIMGDMGGQQ